MSEKSKATIFAYIIKTLVDPPSVFLHLAILRKGCPAVLTDMIPDFVMNPFDVPLKVQLPVTLKGTLFALETFHLLVDTLYVAFQSVLLGEGSPTFTTDVVPYAGMNFLLVSPQAAHIIESGITLITNIILDFIVNFFYVNSEVCFAVS